jgi:hypothetical protein
MSVRTITGNLAADPEVMQAGSIRITKLRIIENTGGIPQGPVDLARDADNPSRRSSLRAR